MSERGSAVRRRDVLRGAGAAALVGAIAGTDARAATIATPARWDRTADIVCVGSGAAALTAAVTAQHAGADVVVLEKGPILGGTTAKSGAVFWIPNNFALRAQGIDDNKADCLKFLCRYAYPERYAGSGPTLGLDPAAYQLLEAFYDNAAPMTDHMRAIGALDIGQWKMWALDRTAPDYLSHVPENKVPEGRPLGPRRKDGSIGQGTDLIAQYEAWLTTRAVPLLTDHRVTRILTDQGRVIGVEAESEGKTLRIRARKAVIFGTGGYAHNTDLIRLHQQGFIYGACAQSLSTGDFIALGGAIGARLGNLENAWRTQVVLEDALQKRTVGLGAFFLPGDSMLVVNKYGRRVVNEKRNYNDRTRVHYDFDPSNGEYANQLLFMIYDQRAAEVCAGNFPLPKDPAEGRHILRAETMDGLIAALDARLAELAPRTGGVALAPTFAATFRDTLARFNAHARAGKDPDFGRGLHDYDRVWELMFSAKKTDTRWGVSRMPNNTLHPLQDKGPYYAIILAGGALDTNGGPVINEKAQVLDSAGAPIPGLYGAGNCIASPARAAYFGAGATIGLAMTYGYIAARTAVAEPIKDI